MCDPDVDLDISSDNLKNFDSSDIQENDDQSMNDSAKKNFMQPTDDLKNGQRLGDCSGEQNVDFSTSDATLDESADGVKENADDESDIAKNGADEKPANGGEANKTFGNKGRPLASGPKVCRDFLNNVCFRGSTCKFEHPPMHDGSSEKAATRNSSAFSESGEPEFQFCTDFPYAGCARGPSCRHVHCSRAEIEEFQTTRRWSDTLARAVLACVAPTERHTLPATLGGRPLCKQHMTGECARGVRCRFWHVDPRDARRERHSLGAGGVGATELTSRRGGDNRRSRSSEMYPEEPASRAYRSDDSFYGNSGGVAPQARAYQADYGVTGGGVRYPDLYTSQQHSFDGRNDSKRARYANDYDVAGGGGPVALQMQYSSSEQRMVSAQGLHRYDGVMGCQATLAPSCATLSDDNAVLRRKIDMLKETLQDMQSANDALLSENTRLRSKTVGAAADQARAVSMASAAAYGNILSGGSGVGPSQATVAVSQHQQQSTMTTVTGLTPEQHMAVVSLAAAHQQHQQQQAAAAAGGGAVIVHPSSYTASSDGLQWSWAQMRR